MKVLAIIPARGGSKGVPGKNIMNFDGQPLLFYSIEAAKKSKLISKLVVNTDDKQIAEVGKSFGCDVVMRDEINARDNAPVINTVIQTIEFFEERAMYFDAVILLQPTSPLRTGVDIDNAIKMLKSKETDAVISMVKVEDNHPARMYEIDSGKLKCLMSNYETKRRQDLPEVYLRNGCIYLIKTNVLKREQTFMPEKKSAYIMDSKWAVNVDTEIDVLILQELIKEWKKCVK
jgi:CMP-N,N'-diacetyllegionaminic acid synthase